MSGCSLRTECAASSSVFLLSSQLSAQENMLEWCCTLFLGPLQQWAKRPWAQCHRPCYCFHRLVALLLQLNPSSCCADLYNLYTREVSRIHVWFAASLADWSHQSLGLHGILLMMAHLGNAATTQMFLVGYFALSFLFVAIPLGPLDDAPQESAVSVMLYVWFTQLMLSCPNSKKDCASPKRKQNKIKRVSTSLQMQRFCPFAIGTRIKTGYNTQWGLWLAHKTAPHLLEFWWPSRSTNHRASCLLFIFGLRMT